MTPRIQHSAGRKEGSAFTLIELLVVIAIIAILAAMILPALGKAKQKTQGVYCMNNSKQLMLANHMYQSDNRDNFPMAMHGGFVPGANSKVRPWVSGWLDWGNGADNTNVQYLLNPQYAVLAQYFGNSKNVYKCPADVYVSQAQNRAGFRERVRSVSGNIYVGKGNGWTSDNSPGAGYTIGGPYNIQVYKGCQKLSDMLIPGPSASWVYMDEHPDSINDAGAFAPDSATNIPDAPASYHNGAAGFAMGDGHGEIHKWRGPTYGRLRKINKGLAGVSFTAENNFPCMRGDPDLYWYSYSTPRLTQKTVVP